MMSRWYQPVFRTRLALHRHSVQEFITTRQGIADLARHHLNFAGMKLPRGNDLRALGRMAWGPEVRIAFAPAEKCGSMRSASTRPKPRNRCLCRAEQEVRTSVLRRWLVPVEIPLVE